MDTKDVLKTKLAQAVKSSQAENARAALQQVLDHGTRKDIDLIKAASVKKRVATGVGKQVAKGGAKPAKEMGKIRQAIKSSGDISKDLSPTIKTIAAAVSLGAAAKPLASKAHRAYKLRKMSPLKRALSKGFGKDTLGRKALTFGAGAAGIAGGIKGIEALSDAAIKPIQKRKAFNDMMDDNPALKKENPKDVKRVFNTLFRFNPKMAGDPLVAGSFMKRTLQFKDEGIQPVDVKTLTEVARNMSGGKSNSILGSAFLGGAKELASFAG